VRGLVDDMVATMHEAPGVGLAAPQIGVQKRFFVYDIGDGPHVIINPEIVETDGVWTFDEGCLSVPDLFFTVERPKQVHLKGWDIEGRDVDVEGDELLGRLFLHEVDHLDGVLVLDRLEGDLRKQALKVMRHRAMGLPLPELPPGMKDKSGREL
jgi:peptide deformylase